MQNFYCFAHKYNKEYETFQSLYFITKAMRSNVTCDGHGHKLQKLE